MPADRRINAARAVELVGADHILVKRLSHAMQALELVRRITGSHIGRRDRMGVMGGELRIERLRVRQQQPQTGQIRNISVQLAREDRVIGVAPLLRPLDLAVPIGALDEADGQAFAGTMREPPQPAQHRYRTLAIGLHRQSEALPAFKLRIGQSPREEVQRQIEPVLLLRVDGHRNALCPG